MRSSGPKIRFRETWGTWGSLHSFSMSVAIKKKGNMKTLWMGALAI